MNKFILILIAIFSYGALSQAEYVEMQKILASDAESLDKFGYSVCISGNYAVIGAPYEDTGGSDAGAAYFFEQVDGTWEFVNKVTASDAAAVDEFGVSVSISGTNAVVGAYGEETGGNNAGAAYFFELTNGTWIEVNKVTASDAEAGDEFGFSVSISGTNAVIGAISESTGGSDAGAAYFFELVNGTWIEVNKVTASDAEDGDRFGYSVSISGTNAVVGARFESVGGSLAGAAYFFELVNGTWEFVNKVTASDAEGGSQFGFSVSISGTNAVIGAPYEDTGGIRAGATYFYELIDGTWREVNKVTASDAEADDEFGSSVSISGTNAVVGAPDKISGGSNAGAAYFFAPEPDLSDLFVVSASKDKAVLLADIYGANNSTTFNIEYGTSSGNYSSGTISSNITETRPKITEQLEVNALESNTEYFARAVVDYGTELIYSPEITFTTQKEGSKLKEMQKILANDAEAGDVFGWSVSISGTNAVVGTPNEDTGGSDAGAAYFFELVNGTWEFVNKVTASDAEVDDLFGSTVSISGTNAIVGAYGEDTGGNSAGAAYFFELVNGSWIEVNKVKASDVEADDFFGWSVSISGRNAIIGAWGEDAGGNLAGAAYFFELVNNSWIEVNKVIASDAKTDGLFGRSVSISGTNAVIGATYESTGGSLAGAAYFFELVNGSWIEVNKVTASDAEADDQFGSSVSISGTNAVIGAKFEDTGGSNAGAAYFYELIDGTWREVNKVTASDAEAGDEFGSSVSISGTNAVIGASLEDTGGNRAGATYFYELIDRTWSEVNKVTASDAEADDFFGSSVAISGTNTVIGANYKSSGGSLAGAAYFFESVYSSPMIFNLSTDVTGTESATFSADITDGGVSTTFSFKYGTESGVYDIETKLGEISAGSGTTTVSSVIEDLSHSTTYYLVAYAENSVGSKNSEEVHFVTCSPVSTSFSEEACQIFEYNSKTYTESGRYIHTFTKSDGCDSLVTLELTIYPVYNNTASITICSGESYEFGSQTLTESGEYTEVFQSVNSCDSIVVLDLTVVDEIKMEIEESICDGEVFTFGDLELTTSGTYTEIFETESGCDSMVTLALSVTELEATISRVNESTLVVEEQQGAIYQWLDCNNNRSSIVGATESTFTPTESGSYAVRVEKDNCSVESECLDVTFSSIKLNSKITKLYPNPTSGEITLELSEELIKVQLIVTNLQGQQVHLQEFQRVKTINTNLNLNSGIYILEIRSNNKFVESVKLNIK